MSRAQPVPRDWSRRRVGDIFRIAIGGTPDRSNPAYWDRTKQSDNLWVSIRDLDGRRINETREYITDAGVRESNVKPIPAGTVLMSFKLTIGRVAFAGRNLYTNEAIAAFLPKDNSVDSVYLSYGLHSWDLLQDVDQAVKGVTLNKEKLENIVGLLPPLAEQRKIAAILSSVDTAIEKTEALIAKLRDLKAAMMQELLTKGIGHTRFKDSPPVGRIPEEWEVVKLADLGEDGISNGVFKDPKSVGDGYRLINVVDMYGKFGIVSRQLERLALTTVEFERYRVAYGDVFFTRSSLKLEGIACCNVNLNRDDDLVYECHLMRVRPKKRLISPVFLAYYCLSDRARKVFMGNAQHSTMTTITQSGIGVLDVPVPTMREQLLIVGVLSSLSNRAEHHEGRLARLQSLKKALMQDLLTGRVRVKT